MLIISFASTAQQDTTYKVCTIAFYNLENLFDTRNDSLIYDDDRTISGKDHWTEPRYKSKIEKLGGVLARIGREISQSTPDLIGLCELENIGVLRDLTAQNNLKHTNYGIVHFDSPDERGIDVGLLYKRSTFSPIAFNSHRLLLYNENDERDYTRDVLVVSGLLDGELVHILVNHWPSRSGGKARSDPYRMEAAALNSKIIDSLNTEGPNQKIIVMGDFNDNPTDESLKKILHTSGDRKQLEPGMMFNPMEQLFKKGWGSLAYRDSWYLFDQILLSPALLNTDRYSYRYWKAGIYSPSKLVTRRGPYRGYPLRTYSGGRYTGGYSDHFPVYVFLVRALP